MNTKKILTVFMLVFVFLGITSCNDEDISTITAIELTPSDVQLLINQEFSFEVKANNSDVITEEAIIKVDGVIVENATFSSADPGDFTVQAFYEEFESPIENISVVYPSGYIQNVLVEDYTGTWCVNCPRLSWAIELAKEDSDKVVSVGVHYYDPMQMNGVDDLINEFGIVSYPTGKINRIHNWENSDQNTEAVTDLTGYGAALGLSINSSINGTNLDATIEVGFNEDVEIPLKLVVYLTENGLLYDQANSTSYYGGENPILNFEHKDVLRAIYTHHLGTGIPASETVENHIYELTLQKMIPATVENNDELHLVAFVTNADTDEVINVREVKVGEAQELQDLD